MDNVASMGSGISPAAVQPDIAQTSVVVSSTAQGSIGPAFAGLSYEKFELAYPVFSASNTSLISLFKLLGPSVLRIGGSSVDHTEYFANGAGQTSGQVAPSDIAALAAFVKATGWQCLYGINLKGCPPPNVSNGSHAPTTPARAAAEVAYAVQAFGSSLLGIEIGNEPDLYGWPLSGTDSYETQWELLRSTIQTKLKSLALPAVKVTGPAAAQNPSVWTVPFSEFVSDTANYATLPISLLTQHYYRADGVPAPPATPPTVANLVSYPDKQLTGDILSPMQTAAASIGLPYRIAECNSYSDGGSPNVSDSYASALWAIDYLFNCAQYGAAGVNFHGGGDNTGTYDGATNGGYTPIADVDSTGTVLGPRPEYYGILLFTLAGTGTLYETTVSVGNQNVTAYAIVNGNRTNVVIVNKAADSLSLTLTFPQAITSATLQQMTQLSAGASGPSLSAVPASVTSGDQSAGVLIQGAEVMSDGTFQPAAPKKLTPSGSQITSYIAEYSAVLISAIS